MSLQYEAPFWQGSIESKEGVKYAFHVFVKRSARAIRVFGFDPAHVWEIVTASRPNEEVRRIIPAPPMDQIIG